MPLLQIALFLYERTQDPLALDAIRALTDEETPAPVAESVREYLRAQQAAYLTLYGNSDKQLPHGDTE